MKNHRFAFTEPSAWPPLTFVCNIIAALSFFLLASACGSDPAPSQKQEDQVATVPTTEIETPATPPPSGTSFPYNLSKPDGSYVLGKKLTEISGLSLSPDGQQLVAVNDEQGIIFYLNKKNGQIEKEVKFGKNGDYEGIETVGEHIYVTKSNGDVYLIENPGKVNQQTKMYETPLNTANDVEGLGHDLTNNRLLLACKGKAGLGKDIKNGRAVYAFDLEKNTLIQQPVFLIDVDMLQTFWEGMNGQQQAADKQLNKNFAPSGIAFHPKTSELWLIFSVGKLLIIIDQAGEVKNIEKLDPDIFKQPEGICFGSDGTLFISSEGKGGKGKLFRFHQN